MTAPAVITTIVKTPARGPSNRFIIENILAVPGIVFWSPFLAARMWHPDDTKDEVAFAGAQSKCCVKFIFIVFCHFMMTPSTPFPPF